jgi:energy-converting hydrogenase A subunit M
MASFDRTILSSIVNMKKEEIEVIAKLIKKTTIRGSYFKIIDAWKKRCNELKISVGDIPEILEKKRRQEIRGRSFHRKRNFSLFDFQSFDL